MARSSRGAGTWQKDGKPCSYCGHSPVHHEGKRPPGALLVGRPAGGALLSALLSAFLRRLAIGRRPRQRQHIEIEAAGLVLLAVLRRPVLAWIALGQRDDGEKEDETQGNSGGACRPFDAMTKHGHPLALTPADENKSEIDLAQRFHVCVPREQEHIKNKME